MKTTRREFAKRLGGAGFGGPFALAGCSQPDEAKPPLGASVGQPGPTGQPGMRRLGRTGLLLSRVGFGAQHTRDSDLIRYALDQGTNHIETVWVYGAGRPGNSCECIGNAIAGRRDAVCLVVEAASRAGIGLIAMKTQSPNYADGEGGIGTAPDQGQALSWVLSQSGVTSAIPGMTTRDQVD